MMTIQGKKHQFGLTPKLVALLFVFACIPTMVVAFIGYDATHDMEDDVGKRFQATAETIADKIDRNLFERYGDVQAFASNRIVHERYPIHSVARQRARLLLCTRKLGA